MAAVDMAVVEMATLEIPVGPGRWTFDDLLALPDSDWRFEIVDGGLLMTPAPDLWHGAVSDSVRQRIRQALPPHLRVLGPLTIDIDPTFLIPDLVVLPDAVVRRGGAKLHPSDALLVVEVFPPGSVSTDRYLKPIKYAEAGIGHFWRVEFQPELSLTVYTLPGDVRRQTGHADAAYVEAGRWTAGQTATITAPFTVDIDLTSLAPDP